MPRIRLTKRKFHLVSSLCGALLFVAGSAQALGLSAQKVVVDGQSHSANVIDGFRFEVVTTDVDSPRLLTFHPDGALFVGTRSGQPYRLAPPYRTAEKLNVSLDYPHSVAFRGDNIYIASTEGLYSARYNPDEPLTVSGLVQLAKIPGGYGHSSRTVKIGPDEEIYVSLGITTNCPKELLDDKFAFRDRRGGVMVLDESGQRPVWKTWARGLRNPVGFDWHPKTGVMYASNNGPDHLGYEQPPEVFARLSEGTNMGMPWYQFDGQKIVRDNCRKESPPFPKSEVSEPAATFPARNAPMDVLFVPNEDRYGALAGNALVALRGSWATQPRGDGFGRAASRRPPALVMVLFTDDGEAVGVENVVTGFQLGNGKRWLRPVGLAMGPDGAIYISSDGGTEGIFRLSPISVARQ